MRAADKVFAGSIPETYESFWFRSSSNPMALDVGPSSWSKPNRRTFCKTVAGTGVLTRNTSKNLPSHQYDLH